MKTPLTYYGGKQKLAERIIKLIPEHRLYCEPFCGGAAVFFRKPKVKAEVLNDTNKALINFYEIVQSDFVSLEKEILISLHARDIHRKAKIIYENPDMFSKLKQAWSIWVLSHMSYSSKLDGSYGYDRSGQTTTTVKNKRKSFTEEYAIRLQDVELECCDALRVIRSRDTQESFFYIDPPYFNSDMGHYDGYTVEDFEMLLTCLERVEGLFLLSSYPSEILTRYTEKNGWKSREYKMRIDVSSKGRKKREILTANYDILKAC